MTFDLIGNLDAHARIVEFLAKLAPQRPNDEVLGSLKEVLGCSGDQVQAKERLEEFLTTLDKSPGNGHQKVRQALKKDPLLQSLIAEPARKESDSKTVDLGGTASGPTKFDLHTEDVAKAIRSRLDAIKDSKVLDENYQEVGLLRLVSQELSAGAPSSGKDLSADLAAFLTERKDVEDYVEDCGKLVWRVFDLLCNRGKKEEAKIIGEVVDLMLPFSLPWNILNEALATTPKSRGGAGPELGGEEDGGGDPCRWSLQEAD